MKDNIIIVGGGGINYAQHALEVLHQKQVNVKDVVIERMPIYAPPEFELPIINPLYFKDGKANRRERRKKQRSGSKKRKF